MPSLHRGRLPTHRENTLHFPHLYTHHRELSRRSTFTDLADQVSSLIGAAGAFFGWFSGSLLLLLFTTFWSVEE